MYNVRVKWINKRSGVYTYHGHTAPLASLQHKEFAGEYMVHSITVT